MIVAHWPPEKAGVLAPEATDLERVGGKRTNPIGLFRHGPWTFQPAPIHRGGSSYVQGELCEGNYILDSPCYLHAS
jgi:hypothetical protein